MAENPTVYQVAQLGVETTAGTLVAATKRLTSLDLTWNIKPEVKTYRPTGYKFGTLASLSKEWTEVGFTGPATYTELIYVFNSLLAAVSPTGAGSAKTWTFTPSATATNTRKTYTIEHGSSDRARRFGYGLVSGTTLNFSRDEVTVEGTIIGKAMVDNYSLTGGTTEVALLPVMPTQTSLYLADTAAGLAGAAAATRAFSASWTLENVSGPVWPLNASAAFAAMTDLVPNANGRVKMAVDAEGMALLTNLRAGSTKFMRIKSLGDLISGADYYLLQVDVAMKVTNVQPLADEDGVYAIEWEYETTYDSTWTKGTEVTVINTLTAL